MPELRGQLKVNEGMASHVSWRAGGPVARAYFPADLDDLAEFFSRLRHAAAGYGGDDRRQELPRTTEQGAQ